MKIASLLFWILLSSKGSMFGYDLHLSYFPDSKDRAMICCHGYGDNYEIALSLQKLGCIKATLVSFNFPEYDIKQRRSYDPHTSSFGSIDEVLPALYAMKHALEKGYTTLDLYGFSAGGGAVINILSILNSINYDAELEKIGVRAAQKNALLTAIQNGIVILDTPLKSIEEIIAHRGSNEELEILALCYRENNLRPIDSIFNLKGLSIKVLLHFQKTDEVLSNRDDDLYIERLHQVLPKESITLVIGEDGGHMTTHSSLWNQYSKMLPYQDYAL